MITMLVLRYFVCFVGGMSSFCIVSLYILFKLCDIASNFASVCVLFSPVVLNSVTFRFCFIFPNGYSAVFDRFL